MFQLEIVLSTLNWLLHCITTIPLKLLTALLQYLDFYGIVLFFNATTISDPSWNCASMQNQYMSQVYYRLY